MISLVDRNGKLLSNHSEELERVRLESPLVHTAMKNGVPMEGIVCILHGFIMDLLKENMRLEQIAPRKIKGKDGKLIVWHCPDELVPLTVINAEAGVKDGKKDNGAVEESGT